MRDYHQKKHEITTPPESVGYCPKLAKLEDEKRIFDLRFQAACAAMQGICANDVAIHVLTRPRNGMDVYGPDVVTDAAIAHADLLLKKLGITGGEDEKA